MKVAGWILLVIGILSIIGSFIGEHPSMGGLFWAVLGAYLIHRANQKKKEEEDKDKWANQ